MTIKEMTVQQMQERVKEIKTKLGDRLYMPGHHYQKDEVIQFADDTGDSLQLAQLAANNQKAEYIVFCGVHFMAETADMLTTPKQKVFLPDLEAGCSMADMANIQQTEKAWNYLMDTFGDTIIPLTYVNSSAAIKAFVGSNGGSSLTSSNAKKVLKWALSQKERVLFLPDQHLGRNTAVDIGIELSQIAVWDPILGKLEYNGDLDHIKIILWKGHCSVHQNFNVQHIKNLRIQDPDVKIIVHPECSYEVVQLADKNGSTNKIIKTIANAPAGSKWAVGTENNLVNRIAKQNPDKQITSLNPFTCNCSTMNRIDLIDLLKTLENIENGNFQNQIKVNEKITSEAKLSLERMLAIS